MALFVVATPIGNWSDLSLRAIEILKSCDLVIGEEKREVEILLKRSGVGLKPYELLNEHSTAKDTEALAKICQSKSVALVTDCGTPGFADPGADLVQLCRKQGTPVSPIPGTSSLMAFLSVTGHRLTEFHFVGFLPRESAERERKLQMISKSKIPVITMDTPYRLKKMLEEMQAHMPARRLVIGCDLTQESEAILEGTATQILKSLKADKAEFLLLILP